MLGGRPRGSTARRGRNRAIGWFDTGAGTKGVSVDEHDHHRWKAFVFPDSPAAGGSAMADRGGGDDGTGSQTSPGLDLAVELTTRSSFCGQARYRPWRPAAPGDFKPSEMVMSATQTHVPKPGTPRRAGTASGRVGLKTSLTGARRRSTGTAITPLCHPGNSRQERSPSHRLEPRGFGNSIILREAADETI